MLRSGNGRKAAAPELHSGEVEIEGDELPDEEPLDWDPAEEAEEEAARDAVRGGSRRRPPLLVRARHRRRQDRGRARLRRGLAHRRHPDPHPPPQPGRPVPGRAARRAATGTASRRPLLKNGGGEPPAGGPVTVETYQWFVRNAGKVSDAYTIVICDEAHTALGEKTSAAIRQWTGPGLHRHDGHRRADRPPRHRPLPHPDLALRPRPGRPARRDRAAALRAHPARRGRALDRQRAAAPRRGGPGLRPGRAGRAARPGAVQPGRGRPLQDALQGPARAWSTRPA